MEDFEYLSIDDQPEPIEPDYPDIDTTLKEQRSGLHEGSL